jgi:hypothetical protein
MLDATPKEDLVMRIEFMPYVAPPAYGTVTIDVLLNGAKVGRWTADEMTSMVRCTSIPRSLITGPELDVTFLIDGPPPPAELGINADTRRLGMLLQKMIIAPATAGSLGCPP